MVWKRLRRRIHNTLLPSYPSEPATTPRAASDLRYLDMLSSGFLVLAQLVMVIHNLVRSRIDLNLSLVDSDFVCISKDGRDFFQGHESRVWEGEPDDEAANETEEDE